MMCSLTALIDRPRIVRTIGILRARAKIGLQNLAYKHSPPGDVGTARRGMKTVEFLGGKKQAGKTIENRTQPELVPNHIRCQNRTLFEVPISPKSPALISAGSGSSLSS